MVVVASGGKVPAVHHATVHFYTLADGTTGPYKKDITQVWNAMLDNCTPRNQGTAEPDVDGIVREPYRLISCILVVNLGRARASLSHKAVPCSRASALTTVLIMTGPLCPMQHRGKVSPLVLTYRPRVDFSLNRNAGIGTPTSRAESPRARRNRPLLVATGTKSKLPSRFKQTSAITLQLDYGMCGI